MEERYQEALEIVKLYQTASIPFFQRTMRLTHKEAEQIITMLEKNRVIGKANGVKPREILTAPTE